MDPRNRALYFKDQDTTHLERYAHLLSALDPRPARLGLYFPRLKGWREWAK